MRLLHYCNEEFELEPNEYSQEDWRYEMQSKPHGLWVSVEGEYDWKWWCEGEGFRVEYLDLCYEVVLKKCANILYINTAEELYEFTKKYPLRGGILEKVFNERSTHQIDWLKVKNEYQGIIIPNYLWECRLSMDSSWYYGWDCSSGSIWDLSCIEEFKLVQNEAKAQEAV